MSEEKPPEVAPPASPTGLPRLPPAVAAWLVPVVVVAGSIAAAPVLGVDVSFLPPVVLKVCALISIVVAPALGIASPGVRK